MKLDESIQQANTLIDQVGHLYQMYTQGVEKFPPIQKRRQLEQLVGSLLSNKKVPLIDRFKLGNLQSRYRTYTERWDKMMKDLESGKIKRTVRGKP